MYGEEISWYTSEFPDSDLQHLRLDVLRRTEQERQRAIAARLKQFGYQVVSLNQDVNANVRKEVL